jgi:hypothetical protein
MATIPAQLAALVVADSRPMVAVALGLVAAAAALVAVLAARGGEPAAPNPEPELARGAARRRLSRLTWLVGVGAAAVTVLTAGLLAVTARGTGQRATSSSRASSAEAPAEVAPESDQLTPPSSVPQAGDDGSSGFGFSSGGS